MNLHQKLFLLLVSLLPLQLGRHFWPEWSYVMGLRVDYLSPTIYLTDVLAVLVLGIWMLEKFRAQSPKPKVAIKNSNLFFITVVFVFLFANSVFAQNQGVAFYKVLKIIEFFLLGLYVAKSFSIFQFPNILASLSLSVVYSSLIAFAQFLKQASLGGFFWWLGERTFNSGTPGIAKGDFFGHLLLRPYATFSHPNVLAGFVLSAFILSASFVYRKNKTLFTFYFLLFTFTIFISFSQAVWLVGLLLVLVVSKDLKTNKWLKRLVCGGAIFLLMLLLIKIPLFKEESFFQRVELAKTAFQLIKQKPLVGVGLNNFIVNLPRFQKGQTLWLQPVHNIYLLVAAETGIVGLIIFLWFLFLTFKKLLSSCASILLYSYISILLLGVFDHYWLTLQQTQLLFAIVLGLIWRKEKVKIKI